MKGRAITLRRAWAGKHFTALFIPNVLAVNLLPLKHFDQMCSLLTSSTFRPNVLAFNLFNISTKCARF